jgi:hypothetical protein
VTRVKIAEALYELAENIEMLAVFISPSTTSADRADDTERANELTSFDQSTTSVRQSVDNMSLAETTLEKIKEALKFLSSCGDLHDINQKAANLFLFASSQKAVWAEELHRRVD